MQITCYKNNLNFNYFLKPQAITFQEQTILKPEIRAYFLCATREFLIHFDTPVGPIRNNWRCLIRTIVMDGNKKGTYGTILTSEQNLFNYLTRVKKRSVYPLFPSLWPDKSESWNDTCIPVGPFPGINWSRWLLQSMLTWHNWILCLLHVSGLI